MTFLITLFTRNQQKTESPPDMTSLAEKLHKDSLAFRLLRLQGYDMNPSMNIIIVFTSPNV